jgi:23S rRNA (adenine2503-C2)-methyltransferase
LTDAGHKPFRLHQIWHALYRDHARSFADMTTIPKSLRDELATRFYIHSLTVDKVLQSADTQTTKLLLRTYDDKKMECVIMRHLSGRTTLCISCQVGCPMACSFCATGKLGIIRNLTTGEIMEQILLAQDQLRSEGYTLRNVVFMGMGEPFINYLAVKATIETIIDQRRVGISQRRVTVSTCGIAPIIRQFGYDFPQVSLAISLHAPTDALRATIMPVNDRYPLADLMSALDEYTTLTHARVFYEYVMIAGVNDQLTSALALRDLLLGRPAHVNFIPYNPGDGIMGSDMQPTHPLIIRKFQDILEKGGIPSTVRHTMGDDIAAACGQLALKEEKHIAWSALPDSLASNPAPTASIVAAPMPLSR